MLKLVSSLLFACASAAPLIISPNVTEGEEVAMLWVQGAESDKQAYVKIATAFQEEAAANGLSMYVGITDFLFSTPEPLLIDKYVGEVVTGLKDAGWNGKELYTAAHSLGSVMIQDCIKDHPDMFKGQILMGGSLARKHRQNNNSTGLTEFHFPVPSMTLAANKDGLYRITRNAESYWHQVKNLDPKEAGRYPVVLLKGFSHSSFMDETMLPSMVKKSDLKAEVE